MSYFFQDELDYLRIAGEVFAHANPKLASHLSSEGDDPDVERFLEGFAYLTGRVRENMAHERHEFNHSLITVLWPNFLRPHPSTTLMCLTPKPEQLYSRQIVAKGTTITSRLVEDVRCPFRTTADCVVYPLKLNKSDIVNDNRSQLHLHFSTLTNLPLKALHLDDLRLTFCTEMPVRQMLYLWFGRYLKKASILLDDDKKIRLDIKKQFAPIGLSANESLLPHPRTAFEGIRILQEFFTFPDKFYGYDLLQLAPHFIDIEAQTFTLELTFERPLFDGIRLMPDAIALHCVPAVNLFAHDGDPLLIGHEKLAYRLRPSGPQADLVEIFSVDNVRSRSVTPIRRRIRHRHYHAFESFLHETRLRDEQIYYRLRPFMSRRYNGFEYDISFVHHHPSGMLTNVFTNREAFSIELTCFNRSFCHELAIGEICYPQAGAADFVRYHNIVRPSPVIHPPLDDTLSWNLLANLALNYTTLLDRDALAALLTIYDHESFDHARHAPARHNRTSFQRIKGIRAFDTQPIDRLCQGLPIRGLKSVMRLRESAFHTEGEMYLFSALLAEFFNLCSTVNSFHELEVWGEEKGEKYQWPARIMS